jgi:Tfp pilus assembly protein PilN
VSPPVFTINFRREVYRRELARARRRMVALGVWVTYFGILAVVIGLYGLNCASLTRRIRAIERQAERARAAQALSSTSKLDATQLLEIEQFHQSPARWRDRLTRLAELLPGNAAIQSVAINPDNLPGPADRNKLEIVGRLRGPDADRTAAVVDLVSKLQRDSLFAAGYANVRLLSSRAVPGEAPVTEFTIECR